MFNITLDKYHFVIEIIVNQFYWDVLLFMIHTSLYLGSAIYDNIVRYHDSFFICIFY